MPPVTGQDAELAGIQRILAGEQYMTVYKAIKPEAEDAATIAVALANGQSVPSSDQRTKVNNKTKDVPSVILTPVAVTKDNVKDTVVEGRLLDAGADLHRRLQGGVHHGRHQLNPDRLGTFRLGPLVGPRP